MLKVPAETVQKQCLAKKANKKKGLEFVRQGGKAQTIVTVLSPSDGWKVVADISKALVFPMHIAVANQLPDLVLCLDGQVTNVEID